MSDSQKYEERRGTGHQNHCCLGLICLQLNKNFMLNVFYLWLLLHSTEEFQRAVRISTGQTLDPYVVHTVFQLFDKDGEIFIFCTSCRGDSLYDLPPASYYEHFVYYDLFVLSVGIKNQTLSWLRCLITTTSAFDGYDQLSTLSCSAHLPLAFITRSLHTFLVWTKCQMAKGHVNT